MGTIRGTFDMNSRPASSALRTLRTEGEKTDVVMQRVGKSLDGIGTTKHREQIRLYSTEVKKLGSQWTQTATRQGASWDKMERKTLASTATQSTAIDELQSRVDELGRSSPTISVNTKGVTESIAEVELLQRRLNELGRSSPTARVGVGGVGSSLARTAAPSGGGSFLSGGLKIPFAGSIPYPLVGAALGAAPPLLGAVPPILGSAGAATLGAGAIGLGGLGALSATVGSIATVAIPAVKGLKESYKALTAYNKAVATNGKNSTQAHTALEKLNAALQGSTPGTRGLLNREQALSSRITNLTKPGQKSFVGTLSNFLGAGNRLAPQLAHTANPLLAQVEAQSGRFSGFLTGRTTRSFLGASGATAIDVLPDVDSTFQHVLATLMNISHASMPFFRESVAWLEQWTGGWATSTGNIDKTRRSISGMVSNLKTWGRLTGATFDLLKDLLSAGTGPGQSLVGDLTAQLEVWDKWVKNNPQQVRAFFTEAVSSTEKIASALGNITGLIWKLGQLLTPLLTQLSQFVTFLDSAGLLTPGSLPLLLGAGAGVQNMIKSSRGRILGTSGGSAAEGVALASAVGAPTAARAGIFARAGGFGSRVMAAGRVPAGMLSVADMEAMGVKAPFSAARAAGYAGGEMLAGARGLGGTFLRGFGARVLPIAALMGGLQAASYQGNLHDRVQAGVSALTLGLVEPPKTDAELQDAQTQEAQRFADHFRRKYGGSLHGIRAQERAINRRLHKLEIPTSPGGLKGWMQKPFGLDDLGPLHDIFGQSDTTEISDDAIRQQNALLKQRRQLHRVYSSQAMVRGGELGEQFHGAFDVRKQHGALAGFEDITPSILRKITELGPAGGRVLGQNVLRWAKEAKRQNPKLTAAYEELVNQIEGRFERFGKHIEIINGRIYTGSSQEWKAIAGAMANPIEQAKEQMSEAFTAIQRQAIGSLTAMGFSREQAKRLVGESEKGGATGRVAKQNMEVGPVLGGTAFDAPHKQFGSRAAAEKAARAHGGRMGRIPGVGNVDNVAMSDGGLGAPNELIVNAHTERRANAILGLFGRSLGGMVGEERYRHSTPVGQMYARGGRQGAAADWRGIGAAGLHPGIRKVASAVLGQFPGLSVTSTTGGQHVSGSYHYLGEAVDIAGSTSVMHQAAEWIKRSGLYRQLTEGIHNPNLAVNAGHFVDPSYYSAVWAEHANHIHLAVAHEVGRLLGLGGGRGGMRGAGGGRAVHLRAPHSGLGGVPGALVNAGGSMYAKGLERVLNRHVGGGGGGIRVGGGGSVPSQIARVLRGGGLNKVGAAGIIGNAYAESSWNPAATGYGGGGLWGFTASPNSLSDLQAYAQRRHQPWTNAGLQTQFLLQHVSRGLISQLNASTSPEAAAALFMNEFERPGIPRQSVREEGARKAFKMGFSRGGRLAGFAGWFGRGGSFTTNGPTLLGVGEGPRKEDVEVRPHKHPGRLATARGRSRGDVHLHFHGGVHVREERDIKKIADLVGKELARVLAEDDGIDEEEVTG